MQEECQVLGIKKVLSTEMDSMKVTNMLAIDLKQPCNLWGERFKYNPQRLQN